MICTYFYDCVQIYIGTGLYSVHVYHMSKTTNELFLFFHLDNNTKRSVKCRYVTRNILILVSEHIVYTKIRTKTTSQMNRQSSRYIRSTNERVKKNYYYRPIKDIRKKGPFLISPRRQGSEAG